VVPQFLEGNAIARTKPLLPKDFDLTAFDESVRADLSIDRQRTTERFWKVAYFRTSRSGHRLFTNPQRFVFWRIAPY
jgi:hypothetical protein